MPSDPDHPYASSRRFKLAAALIHWRYAVAVSALALTVACAFPALELIRLHIKTNIFGLLPQDTPSVRTLTAMIDKAGGWGDLMVVVDSPDAGANRRFVEALDASLAGRPWINFTEHRLDTTFFERNGLLLIAPADLDLVERRLRDRYEFEVRRRDPTYVDLLGEEAPGVSFDDIEARYRRAGILRPFHGSADGTTLVLAIYPVGLSGEIRESRRRVAELESAIAALGPSGFTPGMRVRVGGTFRDRVEEYDLIVRDLAVSAAVMAVMFIGLLWFHFRQPIPVVLVFLTFTLPLFWTFALARAVVAELNLITVFLVNVLSGLGIDFGIHTFTRYLEERAAGRTLAAALGTVAVHTSRACWSAAAVTVGAFLALGVTRFLGFRQFGIIAGFGLTFAFLSAILVLPSLIAIAEDLRLVRHRAVTPHRLHVPARHGRLWLAGTAALAALGIVGAMRIGFEYDLDRLRTRVSPESTELRQRIASMFSGIRDPVVVLAGDLEETAEIQAVLRRTLRPGSEGSRVQAVVSILDLVPPDQPARLERIGRIRALIDQIEPFAPEPERERLASARRRLVDRPITLDEVPVQLRRRFLGRPGTAGNFVFVLHTARLTDVTQGRELARQVREIRGRHRTWYSASDAVVADDLLRVMTEDTMVAVPLSALAVFLVLLADFRSARRALVAAAPLVAGMGWMLAVIWLSGIKLSFYNMVVFPSMIGIGIAAGIHIYHRFLESPHEKAADLMSRIGGAVVMSAVTTMIGFGSMVVSVHRGLRALGLLAVIGLACTLVTALVVFPILLELHRGLVRR